MEFEKSRLGVLGVEVSALEPCDLLLGLVGLGIVVAPQQVVVVLAIRGVDLTKQGAISS